MAFPLVPTRRGPIIIGVCCLVALALVTQLRIDNRHEHMLDQNTPSALAYDRFQQLPAVRRERILERMRQLEALTPEQRQHVMQNWERWQKMTPVEREAARERWQRMTPEERRDAREHPRRARPPH